MRRRRRRKVFWFPNLGTVGPAGAEDDDDYGLYIQQTFDTGGVASSVFVTDLTFDRPIEEDEGSDTLRLSSVVGGEYILRRIVGNCFVGKTSGVGATADAEKAIVMVTAGFFVARAEDSTQEDISARQPIGAETLAELRENYSPASVSTIREPWIWRKRWILGNANPAGTANFVNGTRDGFLSAPPNNMGYPSKHTDQSIDCKTIRRVGNDNRLWFVLTSRILNAGSWLGEGASPFQPAVGTAQAGGFVHCHLDYRLLGHLTRTRSTGTF